MVRKRGEAALGGHPEPGATGTTVPASEHMRLCWPETGRLRQPIKELVPVGCYDERVFRMDLVGEGDEAHGAQSYRAGGLFLEHGFTLQEHDEDERHEEVVEQ